MPPALVLIALLASPAGGEATRGAGEEPTIAFVDMNVVPMDRERVLPHHTVLVQGQEIRTLGPSSELKVPAGATVIDGQGRDYLMPGLVDTHAHCDEDVLSTLFLVHGVTSVINLRGSPQILARRERIACGTELGPTIYTSGPFVNEPEVKTPEQAEQVVKDQHAMGYELIKIHGDLKLETYEELVRAGREYEIPVIGHAPRNLSFTAVLDVGQVWVVHAEELIYTYYQDMDVNRIPELVPRIAEKKLWLTPTLSTFAAIVRQWGKPQVIRDARKHPLAKALGAKLWRDWEHDNPYTGRAASEFPTKALAFQLELVRKLQQAGVRLMAGTDTPLPLMFPGESMQAELDELMRAGLSPFEALVTATRHPGEFITEHVHPDVFFGTVEPLMRADLLVLDGNPLDDVHRTVAPKGVLVHGRYLDAKKLKQMLAQLEAAGG